MGLFSKKYIYLDVCFLHGKHPYTYRTNDSSIAINTVVMVPAGNEIKPAIVTGVKAYKEKDVPIPPEKLKEIVGKADRANRKLFEGIDMRMPMDISIKTVQTTSGHAVVVTDKLERRALKEQFGKRKDIKAYSIVSRDDGGKPIRRGYWKKQEYLSGEITWQCSRCKSVFQYRETFCPKCHSENKKTSYDPKWIDEIEEFDAMIND